MVFTANMKGNTISERQILLLLYQKEEDASTTLMKHIGGNEMDWSDP